MIFAQAPLALSRRKTGSDASGSCFIAFSSEAVTGSREENASKNRLGDQRGKNRRRLPAEFRNRHWPPEQMALRKIHACGAHVFELFLGFDAFGRRHDAETLSQRKHRGDHRLAVAAVDTSLMNDLSILIFSKGKIVR
jgi:hypothetical protein